MFCRILASDEPGEKTYIVRRDESCAVVLNAYPYTSGHLMVMPVRHVAENRSAAPRRLTAICRPSAKKRTEVTRPVEPAATASCTRFPLTHWFARGEAISPACPVVNAGLTSRITGKRSPTSGIA